MAGNSEERRKMMKKRNLWSEERRITSLPTGHLRKEEKADKRGKVDLVIVLLSMTELCIYFTHCYHVHLYKSLFEQ